MIVTFWYTEVLNEMAAFVQASSSNALLILLKENYRILF